MAGHSKWANIQHRKGAQDRRRSRVFGKLIRELTVAAKQGSDPGGNPRLRLAIDRARAQSMPRDTIDCAIRRGAGESGGADFEQVTYEGYGPGGVAVLVEVLTDNRNRTVSEVRHLFARFGGNLGAEGSVAYLFNEVGLLGFGPGADEVGITEAAIEAGAEDVVTALDGGLEVLTAPADFPAVRDELIRRGLVPAFAEVTRRAALAVPVEGETAAATARLLEALEDLDDVQQVYSNADYPADLAVES